jgi:hypothetical protein
MEVTLTPLNVRALKFDVGKKARKIFNFCCGMLIHTTAWVVDVFK